MPKRGFAAMMERREFIQACAAMLGSSVLVAGCGSSGDSDGTATTTDSDAPLPNLSRGRWDAIPSTTFSVAHGSFGAIDMTLVEIEDYSATIGTEQFSIVLTAPETPLFSEGRYRVYNASLGDFELYLQQSESSPGAQRYRAVFSLLT